MKKWIFAGLFLTIAVTVCFAGGKEKSKKPDKAGNSKNSKGPLLLTVDFNSAVPLKYNFVSSRRITINLDPSGKYSRGEKISGKEQEMTEKLEMEITYKPLQVDPLGYSIIEATCNSVKVTRTMMGSKGQKTDAVDSLVGRSFILKITPAGKIADYSNLNSLIQELGQKAFNGDPKRGRIKDPDMIMDFVTTQWSVWDSVASVKKPMKGIKDKQVWKSQLFVPMPFVSKTGRDVEYKLAGIVESNNVSYAEITSTYSLSKLPSNIPLPYSGSFQMRGMFGFLQGYQVLSIEGTGKQLYDIEKGQIKSDTQQYKAKVKASIFGLGSDTLEPNMEVDQTITMTLVE